MPHMPPITRALLIANVLIFLMQQFGGDYLLAHLGSSALVGQGAG